MPSDRSRISDDLRQNYKAVVTQQGRVILDRDFNAMQDIINGELAADATDIIGPCGTPDNGFQISLESASSPPNFWIPPSPLPLSQNVGDALDFLISPGTMYIGGQRAVFPPRYPGQSGPLSYSYFDQPDWINPPAPPDSSLSREIVSLHLFEQEVSAVEDPDLLDVALGGPDTTQRVRLMRRVERGPGNTCGDAATYWSERGFKLDPKTLRLLPQVKLLASYAAPASTQNPCDPVATGGYLGAYNQLIRIEIRNPKGNSPELLWGYDNASFLYRVTLSADNMTLTLAHAPVDTFHQPQQNQVVEVLRTAAVLANDPNEPNPTPSKTVRCVAEARGFVATLSSGYSANADGTGTVVLDSPLPPEYANEIQLFLRIWQGSASTDLTSAAGTSLSDYTKASIGLQVTLTIPSGNALPDGAFWMLAVRPGTPQLVYPERFLENPQPPDGPNQWLCPLAVIDWAGSTQGSPPASPPTPQVIQDCRQLFDNLVNLTKRKAGCCSISLWPEDLEADGLALQAACDRLANQPDGAGGAAICLMPGNYPLARTLQLNSRHSGLTIEACQGAVTLQADNANLRDFSDGLIFIDGGTDVTLDGISFKCSAAPIPPVSRIIERGAILEERLVWWMIGLRVQNCSGVSVENCQFNGSPASPSANVVLGAGILACGRCDSLTIERNQFVGTLLGKASFGFIMAPLAGLTILEGAFFRLNQFEGLTVALLSTAITGTVGIRENTVTSCFGGFWLSTSDLSESIRQFVADGGSFQNIANALARLQPGEVPRILIKATPQFHLADNQMMIADIAGSSGWALLIAAGSEQNSSVVLSANDLRARWYSYTALISGIAYSSITGNVILNLFTSAPPDNTDKLPLSLGVFPDTAARAVTGNVLYGRSNLGPGFPARTDIQLFDVSAVQQFPALAQLNTWKYLNFEPLPPSTPKST